jgi:superfamily II DNA/RNA helicase
MPGRRYVGICALGTRLKSVLIRVYVAYLAAAQKLYEKYGQKADPWLTLVGYFNSLRELGGMRRLVDDDIRERLKNKNLVEFHQLAKRYLNYPYMEELTSRKTASEIPELLDKLERHFAPSLQTKVCTPKPLDVLLATNMISVGVDVRRLGLMIIAGQPKNTAEYIQASSRVGRSSPGLVCTVYNWARPRDLSHYESFEHYHATFYQYVEALSVTPFATGALDRGLTGILVALIRLMAETFNPNVAAQDFDPDSDIVKHALEIITKRANSIEDNPEVIREMRNLLEKKINQWVNETKQVSRQLVYNSQGKKGTAKQNYQTAMVIILTSTRLINVKPRPA